MTSRTPLLSLIVPIGPNEEAWLTLLNQLVQYRSRLPEGKSLQVVLSACEALEVPEPLLRQLNIIQLNCGKTNDADAITPCSLKIGRAWQLNSGAAQADGDFIWFVHADTQLNEMVLDQVKQFLDSTTRKSVVAYFKLRFAKDGPIMTFLNALGANLRSQLFNLPFGDQTLLMHRSVWHSVGSFNPALEIGEDLDWVVRANLMGIRLTVLPAAIQTSARKYQRFGWLKTSVKHIVATVRLTTAAKNRFQHAQGPDRE